MQYSYTLKPNYGYIFTLQYLLLNMLQSLLMLPLLCQRGNTAYLGGEQTTTIRLVLQILPLTCTYTHSHFPI